MVKCMDLKKLLKNYYTKLLVEAGIKAALWATLSAFGTALLTSLLSLLFMLRFYWVSYVAFGVVFVAVFLITFLVVKPTEKEVAARIDLLGLEERVLTMNELKGQDNFVANKQREDTMRAIETVNAKFIAFAISLPLIIAASVVALTGTSATVITTLAANNVIDLGQDPEGPGGGGIIHTPNPEEQIKYFTIEYRVEGEGRIEGDVFQVVEEGGNASPVMAVPDDEWGFYVWLEDGSEEPYRMEYEVLEDKVFTAIFKQGDSGNPSPNGQPSENGNEGQEADDDAQQPGEEGQPGNDGEGQDNPNPSENPSGGAGGQYLAYNQVIDGETYYGGTTYENAYIEMLEELAASGELTAEQKALIEDYFKTIAK